MTIKITGNCFIKINGNKIRPNRDGEITQNMLDEFNSYSSSIKIEFDEKELYSNERYPKKTRTKN
jgi:hypothetical protein